MNRRQIVRSLLGAVTAPFAVRGVRAEQAQPGQVQPIEGVAWMTVRYEEFTGVAGEPLAELALIPMPDMEPGRAYCPRCDRLPAFDIPWQGPDHVAVRLWDRSETGQTLSALQQPTRITVNGDPVKWGLEAYAGPNGWALIDLETGCPRCREYLRELRVGDVALVQPERDRMIALLGRERVEQIESSLLERSQL